MYSTGPLNPWIIDSGASPSNREQRSANEVDDVLVQDPVCKTYVPQRGGIHLSASGPNDLFLQ